MYPPYKWITPLQVRVIYILKIKVNNDKKKVFLKLHALFNKLKSLQDNSEIPIYDAFTELILTDNGFEFDDLLKFCENDSNIHIFFCHPLSSFEKDSCERNHVLIRFIHYKGWDFDNYIYIDLR